MANNPYSNYGTSGNTPPAPGQYVLRSTGTQPATPTIPTYLQPNQSIIRSIIGTTPTSDYEEKGYMIDNKASYFIRLGNLLKFIQQGIMYKVISNGTSEPLLNFDYSVNGNLMHQAPQMMGFDPRLAMVRTTIGFPGEVIPTREYFNNSDGVSDFAESFDVPGQSELGKIMNIYINFQFIINKLKELENKDTNEVSLLDFLKGILAGINSSFGGYSKLDVIIDEDTNTLKIIDQNPLPSINQALNYVNSKGFNVPTNLAYFDLYGYNTKFLPTGFNKTGNVAFAPSNTTAGFIKEFNFTTELTPEFSTMISVAATSNGNVVGENNTALSRINKGLKDRFKEAINGGGAAQVIVSSGIDKKTELGNNYANAKEEFDSYASGFSEYVNNLFKGVYINDEIENYKDSFTVYLKMYKKFQNAKRALDNYDPNKPNTERQSTKFQPGTGFIPFNLSLKVDGLSGMKIGSRFLVDASYLPSNYPDTVDFLIKNLAHEIKDNKWTTTLESYCIAKSPSSYVSPRAKVTTAYDSSGYPACPTDFPSGPISPGSTIVWDQNHRPDQNSNIQFIIDSFIAAGVTNLYGIMAILSVVGKECHFIPKNEDMEAWGRTPVERIRKTFGSRVARFSDPDLIALSKDTIKFCDTVYGYLQQNPPNPSWRKHTQPGDGYKYRGRGFQQITFKASYEKYGNMIGVDLVSDPDKANELDIAGKLLVATFTTGNDRTTRKPKVEMLKNADNLCDIIKACVTWNHGGGRAMDDSYIHAYEIIKEYKFKIQ